MNFKKISGWLHLWLGLICGIVIFIECLTGACLVFEQDIKAWYTTGPTPPISWQQGHELLKPSVFIAKAQALAADYHVHKVEYSKGKAVLVEVEKGKNDSAFYFDPYQGTTIAALQDNAGHKPHWDFFRFATDGHVRLWLPAKIGGVVTNYGTIGFIFLLISGIVLWWPRNRAGLKQRLSFRWKNTTRWKRKNYDLHNILGFYFMVFLLLLTLSGLRLGGMRWVDKSLYWITSGGKSVPARKILVSDTTRINSALPFNRGTDSFFVQMAAENPEWKIMDFYCPDPEKRAATMLCSVKFYQNRTYDFKDKRYVIDQYTFKILQRTLWQDKNVPDLIRMVNWDIHMGTIFDMPSKIIFFLTAITGATLPVSGFLVWLGRKKKKKS